MTSNNKIKSPNKLIHSIATGLKKGAKIFKKVSRGIVPNKISRKESERSNSTSFGQRRRRLRRKRRGRNIQKIHDSKLQECDSFSLPEGGRDPPSHSLFRSSQEVHRLLRRTQKTSNRHTRSIGSFEEDDLQSQVLNNFERLIRKFLSCIGIYLLGAYQPLTFLTQDFVFLLWHYLLIVWGTCVFIKVLAYFAALQQEQDSRRVLSYTETFEDIVGSDGEDGESIEFLQEVDTLDDRLNEKNDEPTLRPNTVEMNDELPLSIEVTHQDTFEKDIDESAHTFGSENEESIEQDWSKTEIITRNDPPQNHPELEDLFLIDKIANERIYPNGEPFPIDNDFFSGNAFIMFRTSDADMKEAPTESIGSASNHSVSNFLRTKKRRFEIQMQCRFKKIPDSPLYLCLELDESFKLGLVQRAFVKATLNFMKQKNPSFSFNLSGDEKVSEEDKALGRFEKPRLTFPVEASLDRLVATKPGEVPPKLGEEIYEDPEAMQERKKGIEYNLEDTYTFSIRSAYMDFLKWKVVNLPAIRPFSLANVNGAQPTSFRFYVLDSSSEEHYQSNIKSIVDIEISNRQATTLGQGMKKWIEKRRLELAAEPLTDHVRIRNQSSIDTNDIDTPDVLKTYDYIQTSGIQDILSSDDASGDADPSSDSDLDIIEEVDEIQNLDTMNSMIANTQIKSCDFLPPEDVRYYSCDTPVWIEMMHRKRRKLQRVYVVRMMNELHRDEFTKLDKDGKSIKPSFLRLRTGKELSKLVRLGFELGMDDTQRNEFPNSHMKLQSTKRRGKNQSDHHVAITKTLNEKFKQKSPKNKKSKKFTSFREYKKCSVAAEMNPADQSCVILSKILGNLSQASTKSFNVCESLSKEISPVSILDSWFLSGSLDELGIAAAKGEHIFDGFVLARCLWESHWREEACIIYENRIEFYSPMMKKPSETVTFHDMKEIRLLSDTDDTSPLLLPQLVVETHWKCHYLAFHDIWSRNNFHALVNSTIFSNSSDLRKSDQLQAHFWQGFHFMTNHASGSTKWAKISSSKKQHHRKILNNRRMSFDCEDFSWCNIASTDMISEFVEDLLRMSLSFTSTNLETSPDEFITFQDKTSHLKNLPVHKLDRSTKETFCVWVNLYHCLLQHSLLLSSRTPTKKTISSFSRTHCYEIGGDIFSLAEIECCVLRGNMSKGNNVKAPFVREPKKSRFHYRYALHYNDPRINFVLNIGDKSKAREIPVLLCDKAEEQLSFLSAKFLRQSICIDYTKKILTLPRICEVYKKDFGDDTDAICEYLTRCLTDEDKNLLADISDGSMILKYDTYPDAFHSSLRLLKM